MTVDALVVMVVAGAVVLVEVGAVVVVVRLAVGPDEQATSKTPVTVSVPSSSPVLLGGDSLMGASLPARGLRHPAGRHGGRHRGG